MIERDGRTIGGRVKDIEPGDFVEAYLPASEVCMSMGLAGKRAVLYLMENGLMVRLLRPGTLTTLAAPITYGEAGIYRRADGTYYVYD